MSLNYIYVVCQPQEDDWPSQGNNLNNCVSLCPFPSIANRSLTRDGDFMSSSTNILTWLEFVQVLCMLSAATSSDVQSPYCVRKMLFPCSHPLLQAFKNLIDFISSIYPELWGQRYGLNVQLGPKHSPASCFLQTEQLWVSGLIIYCKRKFLRWGLREAVICIQCIALTY